MAKVTFTDDLNIKPARQVFPKLNKLKKGEKVRIQLMGTDDIDMEFVHNLEAPVIENGEGVLGPDGKWKMRYMGSPLSFGDLAELQRTGLDPKNCIISKFAKDHPDWVQAPRRKFAMHIIQYRTRQGSYKLSTPYAVEHKVWVFTDKTFLKLQEFAETWGDLKQHDLYIECTNEQFQQYEIAVAPDAAWLTEDDKKHAKHTIEVYKAGMTEFDELELAIGQKKEKRWVQADLEEIEEAWNVVLGRGAGGTITSPDISLDDLVGGNSTEESDDILTSLADAGVTEEDSGGELDFDSLLAAAGLE